MNMQWTIVVALLTTGGTSGAVLGKLMSPEQTVEPRKAHVHHRDTRSELRACDATGPVDIELTPVEVIQRDGLSSLLAVAKVVSNLGPVYAQDSITVFDYLDQRVSEPDRSQKALLALDEQSERQFEIPPGLPDGYYYAELLVAFSEEEQGNPLVSVSRLHFRVLEATIEPMTTYDWTISSGAGSAIPVDVPQTGDETPIPADAPDNGASNEEAL